MSAPDYEKEAEELWGSIDQDVVGEGQEKIAAYLKSRPSRKPAEGRNRK